MSPSGKASDFDSDKGWLYHPRQICWNSSIGRAAPSYSAGSRFDSGLQLQVPIGHVHVCAVQLITLLLSL